MTLKSLFLAAIIVAATACSATAQKRSFGEVVDDEVLALNLRAKFMKDKAVPANDILIRVWKGVVTLKGEMDSQDQIVRAVELAERQTGVREVKAHLVLRDFGRLREGGGRMKPGVTVKTPDPAVSVPTRPGDPLREKTLGGNL